MPHGSWCQQKTCSLYSTKQCIPAFYVSRLRDDFCMPFPSRCLRKLVGLPDHLVRLEQQRRRDGETEGLGGLEVDDQLELRGLLHGQIRGLGPLQDPIHIVGGAPVHVAPTRRIGHEPTSFGKRSLPV